MIIVTSGHDDALMARLRALENPCTSFSIREVPDEELWPCKVVSVDDFEQPAEVTEDCRPQVMILSAGDRNNVGLNAAIAAVLSKAFDVVEEPIGFGMIHRRPKFDPDMFFFPTCYDMEFRWTPLHLKLSLQGTQMKLERQQQRRKALHKFHEQKRAKRGKEHAKQKQKSLARPR